MRRILIAVVATLAVLPAFAAAPAALTLEQIMANPDWIGQAVERPYWSTDGESIYYRLKRDGNSIRDLYQVDPASGRHVKIDGHALADADGPPIFDGTHQHAVFLRHGDIFVRDLSSGALTQVTRTKQREGGVQWSTDGSAIQYRRRNQWFSYKLATGLHAPVAILKSTDNPNNKHPDALSRLQLHLFKTLRQEKAEKNTERAHRRALNKADSTRVPRPYFMGKARHIVRTSLSPNAHWMIAVTRPAHYNAGKHPTVDHYVTLSGYSRTEKARTYVGRNKQASQTLWLLDLHAHTKQKLSVDKLPKVHADPLATLRSTRQQTLRQAGHAKEAAALKAPKTRGLSVLGMRGIAWSADGQAAAVALRANDNKDRWIVSVDVDDSTLVLQDHLHDKAWINWQFNAFGFVPHSHTLWYLSEDTGYAQLYTKRLNHRAKQLTKGHFEVSRITPSPDGQWFYLKANKQAPYAYDIYRIHTDGGQLQRVTQLEAIDSFVLSPDGNRLAILHSSAYVRPQLAVINTDGSSLRELTHTMKPAFTSMQWIQPEIVQVPSSHGADLVLAKLYKAADYDRSQPHPAVFFVHGAGYLQDVTRGWSYYFREQMFNNLLAHEGYIVIDMDYRGSAGYGRDWRTAIYRHMGHPELEDLLDGKAWLVKHYNVDPNRVGIYGGSYGGFMTEMALLRAPGEFAAGAALRPPSDWTTYNDGYTSNILNDPQLDPEAYRVSSPIEFAANLQDPLLICHGLLDNNVLPNDSIRLYQRFIELHKKHFWLSLYPMERHAFEHADAWYDEYRRVHALFTRYVKNRYTTGLPVPAASTAND